MTNGIPELQGFAWAGRFIDLAKDSKRVGEIIKDFEKRQAKLDETVALVGRAKEIDGLLIQARDDRKMAGEELAAAKIAARRSSMRLSVFPTLTRRDQ
mgnify:CR=1 FL=1|jgi:hypothetical protein|tara:strand:+ start:12604 stop:12897 length:294 start_codon:yes stop_codon:yes gene_type:complete